MYVVIVAMVTCVLFVLQVWWQRWDMLLQCKRWIVRYPRVPRFGYPSTLPL